MARFILLLGVFLSVTQLGWGHKLPQKIREEIQAKREDVDRIISYVLEGPGKHQAFERMEILTDDFGHRLSGSKALEDAIDFLLTELSGEGLDNVDGEEVMITNWKRGEETLEMLSPRYERMDILSVGLSPNTSVDGITAEAIVVTSFDELEERSDEVPGKIVVYNQPFLGYPATVIYRTMGGVEASRRGAVAALVRSLAPFSLYTPHAGHSTRVEAVEPIPTAAITIEDAELLYMLHSRGKRLELRLTQSQDLGLIESRNIVAEVQGAEIPEEALSIMKALDLQPKRTMRMVMWTGEETGIHGADQYYERHQEEAERMSLALESDGGSWTPYGIGFTGSDEARAILEEVMQLLTPINATLLGPSGGGADIDMWEDFLLTELSDEGLDNVDGEEVMITNWKRGEETLEMLSPRYERMDILSVGLSPNTSVDGITAEAIVVTSFDELEERSDEVPGKIVVYNQPFLGYPATVIYRTMGGVEASRRGAVAALVRSIAPFSLYTPHAGHSTRVEAVEPIPTAAITIEDAELLYRLHSRGKRLELRLTTQSQDLGLIESRYIVAEVQGAEIPEELVMFGGHIDSWDVGTGAIDDAGGCIISWQALSITKALDLQPKRTMRMVMWTGEETGIHGADQYYERHQEKAERMSLALESDGGSWTPYGIGFTGSDEARAILEEVMQLLTPINATLLGPSGGGADIDMWEDVPKGTLINANDDYFFYHHTRADTISAMDADEVDLCTIVWTVVNYVVADLDDLLPRD